MAQIHKAGIPIATSLFQGAVCSWVMRLVSCEEKDLQQAQQGF
jgi:hypothetical protein